MRSISFLFLTALLEFACLAGLVIYVRHLRSRSLAARKHVLLQLGYSGSGSASKNLRFVGFFHPYCNTGGGGERVLWTAIAAIQRTDPSIISVVYTGDVDATKDQIIHKVKARFDIALSPSSLHFVFLRHRTLVEDAAWPRFTLLGQSLGSMVLAWEAMCGLIPDLYIDTMGYAFTFHVVSWLGGIPVGTYTHYPTISTDMLARVRSRKRWHTNSDVISSSAVLSRGKLLYYRLFMYYYALSLRGASFIMVNSSWTKSHIDSVLQHSDPLLDTLHALTPLLALRLLAPSRAPRSAKVVYPACDTREMAKFGLGGRERVVLSIAQFRPEKDHAAQLYAFRELLKMHPSYGMKGDEEVRLVLLGGSRNDEDAARVEALRRLAKELDIQYNVEFVVNASYPSMLSWLSTASIGLSTMVDEHFGINVVEFMAAGVIPVTHASGGPLNDIVVPFNGEPTGYHATSPETFAAAMESVLTLPAAEEVKLRERARRWAVEKFSEEEFEKGWNGSGWRDWL
ncbi:glycosyltransferase family 4 protein [Serpula lacrymans var. lacrymans S7.3]|uniref:GDP-Man:Man(3)GlcNAc(2)-PP-Dol alpha-1,2-mannosyltransferase n=2 Tax=Serpula lacrymans var. lacrymans TaxID=341189 RepID=F8Q0U3_SERL3|nr:glycosyltransferase family 4 protein [Serpula lacrymans var. lacrymans S7.9]EGN97922.1 glycosyltransferase family 4 protein [Serpula lacrymans var. lacrymans S7.3]EGO23508.1 glycosyltransferase family 4 protein [Serpula lacrymans var. lacrymans S7.9]